MADEVSEGLSEWGEKDISRFLVVPLQNKATNKSSYVWRYFGDLVVEENHKRRKIFEGRVFCTECLNEEKRKLTKDLEENPDNPRERTQFKR